MKERYIVSVGSNIDAEKNERRARQRIQNEQRLLGSSTLRITSPVGFQEQPDFLNGAYYIESELEPAEFKKYLQEIESFCGRVKTDNKSGPRTMDLDIIAHNNRIVHPDYPAQDYVRLPVQELLEQFRFELKP